MSGFAWGLVLAGALAGADPVAADPARLSISSDDLRRMVTFNEAAVDQQVALKPIEIRGTAKRINRTETGSYVLQFLPEHSSENFVLLHVDFEFAKESREALSNLKLPADVTIRGTVRKSDWMTVYDNHRHYKIVVKGSEIGVIHPEKNIR